jgi:hypothetical protein
VVNRLSWRQAALKEENVMNETVYIKKLDATTKRIALRDDGSDIHKQQFGYACKHARKYHHHKVVIGKSRDGMKDAVTSVRRDREPYGTPYLVLD